MKHLLLAWAIFLMCAGAAGATTNAWERTDAFVPPDFNGYFSADASGGERLDEIVKSGQLENLPVTELTGAIQKGLRTSQSHKLTILRSFGNRFIWGKSPQKAEALELMYHAAGYPTDPDPNSTAYWAVYFGLSVAEHKTPNILHTLVDLCMKSNDPNLLSRVAWGIRAQRDEGLAFLQPYLDSKEPEVRQKASLVSAILNEKTNAFAWAREETRKKAEATYRGELPAIKRTLAEGTSDERSQVIRKIFEGGIVLIMDDSFLPAFDACAHDSAARVRSNVAKIVGGNWIWNAEKQNPEAIRMLLQLTRDPDPQVRYDAVYHGLSTVRQKSEELARRLVEMHLKDNIYDIRGRISWSFQNDRNKESFLAILAEYLHDPNPEVAQVAAAWYQNAAPKRQLPEANAEPIGANAATEIRKRLGPAFAPFVLHLADGQRFLLANREKLALGEQVLVIIEAKDQVRTLDLRQITTIEDIGPAGKKP